MGKKVLSLFFSLPMTIAMRSHLLNDIVREGENVQLPSVDTAAGFILSKVMSTSAVNGALIPVKKAY